MVQLAAEVHALRPGALKLPHIGWNRLHDLASHPLVAGLEDGGGLGRHGH